eukprot:5567709-Amphidinium_carterae.3
MGWPAEITATRWSTAARRLRHGKPSWCKSLQSEGASLSSDLGVNKATDNRYPSHGSTACQRWPENKVQEFPTECSRPSRPAGAALRSASGIGTSSSLRVCSSSPTASTQSWPPVKLPVANNHEQP